MVVTKHLYIVTVQTIRAADSFYIHASDIQEAAMLAAAIVALTKEYSKVIEIKDSSMSLLELQ